MRKLTGKQYNNLGNYSTGGSELVNGETAFCSSRKVLVVCCPNCGRYKRLNATKIPRRDAIKIDKEID